MRGGCYISVRGSNKSVLKERHLFSRLSSVNFALARGNEISEMVALCVCSKGSASSEDGLGWRHGYVGRPRSLRR